MGLVLTVMTLYTPSRAEPLNSEPIVEMLVMYIHVRPVFTTDEGSARYELN